MQDAPLPENTEPLEVIEVETLIVGSFHASFYVQDQVAADAMAPAPTRS